MSGLALVILLASVLAVIAFIAVLFAVVFFAGKSGRRAQQHRS
ncbi:hypothetical protein [Nocardioides sp. WS12]|nr:hypothetical protein [Nocardioides sp. WS12]